MRVRFHTPNEYPHVKQWKHQKSFRLADYFFLCVLSFFSSSVCMVIVTVTPNNATAATATTMLIVLMVNVLRMVCHEYTTTIVTKTLLIYALRIKWISASFMRSSFLNQIVLTIGRVHSLRSRRDKCFLKDKIKHFFFLSKHTIITKVNTFK